MPIAKANDLEDLDDDILEEEGDGTQYNMRELMDQVYNLRDCIITVPTEEVPALKHGLITRKAKDNTKFKKSGVAPDPNVLSFHAYTAKDEKGEDRIGISDVRVKLGPKKSVTVLNISVPSNEL